MGQGGLGAASQELEHLAGAWFQAVGGKSCCCIWILSEDLAAGRQPPLPRAELERATPVPRAGRPAEGGEV